MALKTLNGNTDGQQYRLIINKKKHVDIIECNTYRGIKLASVLMKPLDRIIDLETSWMPGITSFDSDRNVYAKASP